MAVEEQLVIDLSELTSEAADKLAAEADRLAGEIDNVENLQKKKSKQKKPRKPKGTPEEIEARAKKKEIKEQKKKEKLAKEEREKNRVLIDSYTAKAQKIASKVQNPFQTIQSTLLKNLPGFGLIVAATAIITKIITQINDIETRFLASSTESLSIYRTNQLEASVQAGLEQLIITDEAGSTDVRISYNNFNREDSAKQKAETDYISSNTSGFD